MVHHPELNSNNDISNITLSGISTLSMHQAVLTSANTRTVECYTVNQYYNDNLWFLFNGLFHIRPGIPQSNIRQLLEWDFLQARCYYYCPASNITKNQWQISCISTSTFINFFIKHMHKNHGCKCSKVSALGLNSQWSSTLVGFSPTILLNIITKYNHCQFKFISGYCQGQQLHFSDTHGATENAGLENAGPSKMQGWKTRDQFTRVENAGLENTGP